MKNFKLILLSYVSAICFAACADIAAPPQPDVISGNKQTPENSSPMNASAATTLQTPDELAAAREIYQTRCVRCHKETGEGGETVIEDVKIESPSFKDWRVAGEPDAEYVKQIKNGGDGMPAYKNKLSDAEINDLVRFIRREFQGK